MAVTSEDSRKSAIKHVPDLPLRHVIRAWLFIPGLYIGLAMSVGLMAAIGAGLVIGFIYVAEWLSLTVSPVFTVIFVLVILAGIFMALAGIIRALTGNTPFMPALMIDFETEPGLVAFIRDLCGHMDTRMPDSIVLHADANFLIQKGPVRVFNGEARGRVLALGLPVIGFISVNELRAILAHELAHFTGNDAIFSSAVLPVYTKLASAIEKMDRMLGVNPDGTVARRNIGCMATPMVLPWLVLGIHWWAFHRFNIRISRLRESRADVVAAFVCGSVSLSSALRKVGGLRRAFQVIFDRDFAGELVNGRSVNNYCSRLRDAIPDLDALITAQEALGMKGSESSVDTHPALEERLRGIPVTAEGFADSRPAAGLLLKIQEYEEQVTRYFSLSLVDALREDRPTVSEKT